MAYMDVGQGREQDAEALLVAYLEQLKGAPRALIDAFSAHNRGGDERSTSPNGSGWQIKWAVFQAIDPHGQQWCSYFRQKYV